MGVSFLNNFAIKSNFAIYQPRDSNCKNLDLDFHTDTTKKYNNKILLKQLCFWTISNLEQKYIFSAHWTMSDHCVNWF